MLLGYGGLGAAEAPSKPQVVQSQQDAFLCQPPQKLQAFLAILDRRPRQANLIDDELLQLGLLLLGAFPWLPSGGAAFILVFWILSVSYDGNNGPHANTLAIFFAAGLADLASTGASFRLANNPTPPECGEMSK